MLRCHLTRFVACSIAAVATAGLLAQSSPGASPRRAAVSRSKALLVYDLEGLRTPRANADVRSNSKTYAVTRESLTEEVNAAIAGLLDAGATEVVVTDGHASGNPEPDYLVDRLPKRARFDTRDAPYDPYLDAPNGDYAAMVAIGMHCGAAGRGFVCHTVHGHTRWTIGGAGVDESMIVAASAARYDTPLVLVTGDDALKEEVAAFSPATRYVVTKRALGGGQAEPGLREDVLGEIEAAAAEAYRARDAIAPWRFAARGASFENRFSYIAPEMAAVALEYPGTSPVDNKTVALQTRTFEEAYLAFRALGAFTTLARYRTWVELERETPAGADAVKQAQARWNGGAGRDFSPTGSEIDRVWSSYGRHGYQ